MRLRAIAPAVVAVSSTLCSLPAQAKDYYVATTGSDGNPGTAGSPWRTVQKAASTAGPGDTVLIRGGVYGERVTFKKSGSPGKYITFKNYASEQPVIDAKNSGNGNVLQGSQKSYIKIIGLEVRNGYGGCGVRFNGKGSHIEIRDCVIHDIAASSNGGSAIAFFGDMSHMIVDGNEVHDCKTTNWEAVFVREHGHDFQITNNHVHHTTNIGIDIVGWVSSNHPRNGLIKGNVVHDVGMTASWASGLYSDGGSYLTFEENIVYQSDYGVTLGAEASSDHSKGNIVRRNLFYNNRLAGIQVGSGGIGNPGTVRQVTVVNNVCYNNLKENSYEGDLFIDNSDSSNVFKNNIIYNDSGRNLIRLVSGDATLDHNCYWGKGPFQWKGSSYSSFKAYQSASKRDQSSIYADPQFTNAPSDFHLKSSSPCIDKGTDVGLPYSGPAPDIGRYEHGAAAEPKLAVSPKVVKLAALIGGPDPPPRQVQVANSGGGTLGKLAAAVSYDAGNSQGWLQVNSAGSGNKQSLTNTAHVAGLQAGSHSAVVKVSVAGAGNSPVSYTVLLTIQSEGPLPDLNAGASDSAQPGGPQDAGAGAFEASASDAPGGGQIAPRRRRLDGGCGVAASPVPGGWAAAGLLLGLLLLQGRGQRRGARPAKLG